MCVAQVPGVRLQPGGPGGLVLRLHRLEVAAERDLRVDDHALAADQPDHEVGPQPCRPGR